MPGVRAIGHSDSMVRVAFVLTTLVLLSAADPVVAPPIEPPWIDFAITKATQNPLFVGSGDLVIFQAEVQILQTNMVLSQWVVMRCLLDEKMWYENKTFIGAYATIVYTQIPWKATVGSHVVTWIIDPEFDFTDPYPDSNVVTYSFVVDQHVKDFDFSMSPTPGWRVAATNGSTSFQISIYSDRATSENVVLSLDHAPAGIRYSFLPAEADTSFSSTLNLSWNRLSTEIYYLTINASSPTASHSVIVQLVIQPPPPSESFVSFSIAPSSLTLGENLTVYGGVSPPHRTTVTLMYTRPEGLTFATLLKTDEDGRFTCAFKPDVAGNWTFFVVWTGDINYLGSQSSPVNAVVQNKPVSPVAEFLGQLESTPILVLNATATILVVLLLLMLFCAAIVVRVSAPRKRIARLRVLAIENITVQ
jgi:hypothetical protein